MRLKKRNKHPEPKGQGFLVSARNNDLLVVNFHKLFFLSYIILPLVSLDQVTKSYFLNPFFYVCNSLGVFGLAMGGMPVYLGVLLLVAYLIYIEKRKFVLVGLASIFAGGISNIIDRLFLGCVRDFVSILHFPTFNFADVFITIGVILVIFGLVKDKNDRYSF